MAWPFRKKVVIRPEISPDLPRVVELAGRGATDTTAWQRDPRDPSGSWGLPDVREDQSMPDDQPDPVSDSGVHQTDSIPLFDPCPHCFGTGKVMTRNDVLRQSLTLLGTDSAGHHALVAEFYRRLLLAAPGLAAIFPADLTDPLSSGKGKAQRDKLLGALLDVGQNYDPDRPDSEPMQILLTHVEVWGRAHSAFARPDGSVRGASLREYGAVFEILMGTLRDATGASWSPRFDEVWEEAFDFAARGMIASAWASGFASARYPRR